MPMPTLLRTDLLRKRWGEDRKFSATPIIVIASPSAGDGHYRIEGSVESADFVGCPCARNDWSEERTEERIHARRRAAAAITG